MSYPGGYEINQTGLGGGGGVAIADSAGTQTSGTVQFSNANGVSWGLNAGTITATVQTNYLTTGALSNHSHGFSAVGGSAGFQTLNFTNIAAPAGNFPVSFSNATGSVQAYVTMPVVSDTATSIAFSRLAFTQSNGLTLTLSTGANAATVIGSYTVPTVTNSSWTVSDAATSGTVQRLAFTNLNGVTLSLSTGAGGSHTIVGSHNALTSQSNQAFSADAMSNFQTLVFQNSNGLSFSNNAGSLRMTHDLQYTSNTSNITANALNTSQSTLSMFAVSNTTQSTVGTAAFSRLSFAGAGVASVGVTGGSVVISVPAGGGGGFSGGVSTDGNTAGSTGTVSNQLVFVGSNNISLSQSTGGVSSATVTILGPNLFSAGVSTDGVTAGSTGTVSNRLVLVGTNGILLSQSTGGASSATISIQPQFQSYFRFPPILFASSTNTQAKQSTSVVFPFEIYQPISFDFLRMIYSAITWGASTTAATTGNSQFSGGFSRTHNIVIYSRGVGANSLSLQYVTSAQITDDRYSFNASAAANSTQFSYSMRYTFPVSTGSTGVTKDYSSSAASLNFHSSHVTDLTAGKIMDLKFGGSLSPGQYWMAYGISSATQTQFTADVTRNAIDLSNIGATVFGINFGQMPGASNQSTQAYPAHGMFQTAGGGTTNSIPFANITVSNNHWFPQIQLMRIT